MEPAVVSAVEATSHHRNRGVGSVGIELFEGLSGAVSESDRAGSHSRGVIGEIRREEERKCVESFGLPKA